MVNGTSRKLKPAELLLVKADTVSNPMSQAYIDRNIKSKENEKITNRLIRNEDMTREEALKAKKQLKPENNSLPPGPVLSTRT